MDEKLIRNMIIEWYNYPNWIKPQQTESTDELVRQTLKEATRLRNECYEQNEEFERVLNIPTTGLNHDNNKRNWAKILEQLNMIKIVNEDIIEFITKYKNWDFKNKEISPTNIKKNWKIVRDAYEAIINELQQQGYSEEMEGFYEISHLDEWLFRI